jgi:uncharacterized protein with ATP-grasp and redox domains
MISKPLSASACFPLLADPERYCACETNLLKDEQARQHWLRVFEDQLPFQLEAAKQCGASNEQVDAARDQFLQDLRDLHERPDRYGRLDILLLDQLRQRAFRGNGIADEMKLIKVRENEAALAAFPERLAEVDAINDPHKRWLDIIEGMLAGNLFDMGVEETAAMYAEASVPFAQAREKVPTRPWLVDHVDHASEHLRTSLPRKAVVFADNAGCDLILGLLPLVREFLRGESRVVLTANSAPAHNDVTHEELIELMPRIIAADPAFGSPRLSVVPSGNDAPLIDLRSVSHQLATAAADADFIVLVGMGRSLETNFTARFTVPAIKVAMVKDPEVARALGGKVYDAVCRFDEAVVG